MTPPIVTVVLAEDDSGHARLIEKNLRRAGVLNPITRLTNGQEVLDYPFEDPTGRDTARFLVLLDIRMPMVDGVQVLRHLKTHPRLRRIPVTMLTTTDDPREVARCHELACSHYIVKPVDYERFAETIQNLGSFLKLVAVPEIRSAQVSGDSPDEA